MAKTNLERPGIGLGLYPEAQRPDRNWAEQAFSRLNRFLNPRATLTLSQGRWFVRAVTSAGESLRGLTEQSLQKKVIQLRRRLYAEGMNEDTVSQSFALVREMAARTLKMRHHDVQLIGGWAMLGGRIAEMETGEGKTLTATLPAATAALAGIPVHLITVNDYLVKRDMEWMCPLYEALGLKTGLILEGMDYPERQENYSADITYCTNKQVAFDYLKDRLLLKRTRGSLKMQIENLNQENSRLKNLLLRGLYFALVDEADSVLIDEARTPLIISKNSEVNNSEKIYGQALDIGKKLSIGDDFLIEFREKKVELTSQGILAIHNLTRELGGIWKGLFRSRELVIQALTALHLYVKDTHYMIQEEKVQIIDEFTGRVMPDRSWEKGLHQMIEVKEGCPMSGQRETLARITYQQFFRRYLRVGGMTGTAQEVRGELSSVYDLETLRIPTHRPVQRVGLPMRVFRNNEDKWEALVNRVQEIHRQNRPILIGTRSVAVSELLSSMLEDKNLPHRTLNARQNLDEANIVKQAGLPGRITVATNMAGRGTDIKLAAKILDLGGLHVIASEPHEARRIDRQLFGRCGRQGNPGTFEMFFSYEDEVIRIFGPKLMIPLVRSLRVLTLGRGFWMDSWVLRRSQKTAEKYFAEIRKRLMKMDKHVNKMLAFSGQSE